MAGTLNVDTLKADSNLKLQIATANVAFIDSNGLNIVGGNLTLSGTTFATGGQVQNAAIATGAITGDKIASVNASVITTGTIPKARLPAGSILQVVNATYSTEVSTTTTTFIDTGLTASITPTSSSSKILVLVDIAGVYKSGSDTGVNLKLLRNSTDLITFAKATGYTGSSASNMAGTQGCNYLDSPSTTSSTTYKVQFMSVSNSSLARVQDNAQTSTITLIEVAV